MRERRSNAGTRLFLPEAQCSGVYTPSREEDGAWMSGLNSALDWRSEGTKATVEV